MRATVSGAGNGLAETERQRVVLVGAGGERLVDEDVAGNLAHGRQHHFVADALVAQALDHAQARALRGHADAADACCSWFGRRAGPAVSPRSRRAPTRGARNA